MHLTVVRNIGLNCSWLSNVLASGLSDCGLTMDRTRLLLLCARLSNVTIFLAQADGYHSAFAYGTAGSAGFTQEHISNELHLWHKGKGSYQSDIGEIPVILFFRMGTAIDANKAARHKQALAQSQVTPYKNMLKTEFTGAAFHHSLDMTRKLHQYELKRCWIMEVCSPLLG